MVVIWMGWVFFFPFWSVGWVELIIELKCGLVMIIFFLTSLFLVGKLKANVFPMEFWQNCWDCLKNKVFSLLKIVLWKQILCQGCGSLYGLVASWQVVLFFFFLFSSLLFFSFFLLGKLKVLKEDEPPLLDLLLWRQEYYGFFWVVREVMVCGGFLHLLFVDDILLVCVLCGT